MIAALISGLTSASLSVLGSLISKKMFESIIRKMLLALLTKIVASTENTVDDDLIKPILEKLKEES